MKKIFGELNLTWPKIIVMAVIMGVYTAVMVMIPATINTSFSDLGVTFEVWILFGILIIMNSKSAKESALKCFIFFLISQPLIYLVQDIVNHSNLFVTYYKYWFLWTIACVPMGFIGFYMKKDKWWGLLILAPILVLLYVSISNYVSQTIFSFPRHLLSAIFSIGTTIMYPLVIFKNKKIRITGLIISLLIVITACTLLVIKPPVYKTVIMTNGGKLNAHFDDTYRAYLSDPKYGTLSIVYDENLEDYTLVSGFRKAGKTEMVIESADGEKQVFNITIKRDTYKITKKD